MKNYAASIVAFTRSVESTGWGWKETVTTSHGVVVVQAANDTEAFGAAMLEAYKTFPPAEGFNDHSAKVVWLKTREGGTDGKQSAEDNR